MSFHDRAVDQIETVARLRRQRIEYPFPDAAPRPPAKPIVGRRARTIALRQIAPRYPGAQDIEDRVHDPTIIHPRAPPARRHQGLKDSPFRVFQIKSHDPPPLTVNHDSQTFSRYYVSTDPNTLKEPSSMADDLGALNLHHRPQRQACLKRWNAL